MLALSAGVRGEMSEKAASAVRNLFPYPEPQTLQMAEDSALGGGSECRLSQHLGQTWGLKVLSRP